MKKYLTFLLLLCALNSNAQTTNFRHDIGIKLSTNQPERFQLQYRFHASEKWAYSANAYFGIRNSYYSNGDYIIQDSIYEINSLQLQYHSYGIDFGAIRKLSFMKHNFYYVGGSFGVGATTRSQHYSRMTYETSSGSPAPPYGVYPLLENLIDSEHNTIIGNSMNVNTRLFIGADVPIVDRLTFNFELGIAGSLEVNTQDQFAIIEIPGYLTGGLRYRFGKTEN